MNTLQLNEELQRQLNYISNDAELMKKAINYIKRLGRLRSKTYEQDVLNKDMDELLTAFHTDNIAQEDIDRECKLVREERYNGKQ
ncbi:MAG: hypothetical protein ACTTKN_10400 [Phocaeicola sp.]|uniref:hypothetical protein n=1 Tax=Phocaeicola TaxID=909656 RepID=UPI00234FA526|nr:hypothetical protein [Phocaeicola oris]MCE2616858.1 hypothetical protein [Phocaeicola oris]